MTTLPMNAERNVNQFRKPPTNFDIRNENPGQARVFVLVLGTWCSLLPRPELDGDGSAIG